MVLGRQDYHDEICKKALVCMLLAECVFDLGDASAVCAVVMVVTASVVMIAANVLCFFVEW